MESRLLDLIGKKQAGEISPSELIELNKLIQADPAGGELLNTLESIWDVPLQEEQGLKKEEISRRLDKIRERRAHEEEDAGEPARPVRPSRVVTLLRFSLAAACILLVTGAYLLLTGKFKLSGGRSQGHNNVVATKNGSHSRVSLPDGTEVWLNAGSNLVYDETFGKETRELRLTGEAYFDVVKDAEHPFVIHTRAMNIRVLGTQFNVRAYPDEKTTEASLLKGSIEISLPGRPSDRMLLKPNEKISVRNGGSEAEDQKDSLQAAGGGQGASPAVSISKITYVPGDTAAAETSWVRNKLIFRNQPFDELAREMERWYNVVIVVKNGDLLQKRFTGTFFNESVREALDKLKVSYPFKYSYDKKNNTIIIE